MIVHSLQTEMYRYYDDVKVFLENQQTKYTNLKEQAEAHRQTQSSRLYFQIHSSTNPVVAIIHGVAVILLFWCYGLWYLFEHFQSREYDEVSAELIRITNSLEMVQGFGAEMKSIPTKVKSFVHDKGDKIYPLNLENIKKICKHLANRNKAPPTPQGGEELPSSYLSDFRQSDGTSWIRRPNGNPWRKLTDGAHPEIVGIGVITINTNKECSESSLWVQEDTENEYFFDRCESIIAFFMLNYFGQMQIQTRSTRHFVRLPGTTTLSLPIPVRNIRYDNGVLPEGTRDNNAYSMIYGEMILH